MKIALTGGSGFVGAAVIDRLAKDGAEIRALVHRRRLANPGLENVPGGMNDDDALRRLCEGADIVVHIAGLTQGEDAALFAVNRDATRRLADIAREAGVPRFLSISSLAAARPEVSGYAASKAAGEDALEAVFPPEGRAILRPPAVYGPGDAATAPFFDMARRGFAPVLRRDDGAPLRFSLIYVDDLAEAVVRMMHAARWRGERTTLHDGHRGGYEWGDVWDAYERVSGRRLRRFGVSQRVARRLARIERVRASLFGGSPALTAGKVRELFADGWVVGDNDAIAQTGWRPSVDLDEGLRRTAAWLAGDRTKAKRTRG